MICLLGPWQWDQDLSWVHEIFGAHSVWWAALLRLDTAGPASTWYARHCQHSQGRLALSKEWDGGGWGEVWEDKEGKRGGTWVDMQNEKD